jgi:hypothetical protein
MGSIVFSAMAFCGAASAGAQELSRIVVEVPFEFIVNGKTLPAGRYRVQRQFSDSDSVFYIGREGGAEGTSFTTSSALDMSAPNNAALVFHHYGSTYYLSEILTGSRNTGYRLPVSRAERAAARVQASAASTAGAQPGRVTIGGGSK